jgi:transposase
VNRSWIAGDQPHQPALLPVDARALLPAEHRVWDILAMVGELDLSAFEAAYRADGRGRPPFHPRVMLALILYCRSKGIMSGREVAAACYDDLGARVITGNRHPDRSTIDRFVAAHAAALKGLLPQTLRLGHAEDLVDVSLVAADGTKALANAAMHATVTEADLLAQITDLHQQLATAEAAWLQQVGTDVIAQQPPLFTGTDTDLAAWAGGVDHSSTGWRNVRTLAGVLRSRQSALAYLRTHPDTAVKDWQVLAATHGGHEPSLMVGMVWG